MSKAKSPRVFEREFKLAAVKRMPAGESPSALARELDVRRKLLYDWPQRFEDGGEERDRLKKLALEHRHYGYRRLTRLLRREGYLVTHKSVLRMMREGTLLALRKRRGVITTNSDHRWITWPNLARWTRSTGRNQLWVSDITYLRLSGQFCYLAVVLDVVAAGGGLVVVEQSEGGADARCAAEGAARPAS